MKKVLFILIIIGFGFGVGIYTKKSLSIKEYAVINSNLPESLNGLTVVHFLIFHFGTTIGYSEFEKVVSEINLFKPDVVFFTGDLIDRDVALSKDDIDGLVFLLNEIEFNISMYSVKGNHDYKTDFDKIIGETDFIVLKNRLELFYYEDIIPIQIIGLDSLLEGDLNVEEAFSNYSDELYSILLVHEPDSYLKVSSHVDLVLGGHSHNGQVKLPFIGAVFTPEGAKSYYDDEYILNNSSMYISSGLGTTKIPIRFFNAPSFNVYRLYNK